MTQADMTQADVSQADVTNPFAEPVPQESP